MKKRLEIIVKREISTKNSPPEQQNASRICVTLLSFTKTSAAFLSKQTSFRQLWKCAALAIDAENAAANPNNAQYQLDLSFSYNSIASSLANHGEFSEALKNCQ